MLNKYIHINKSVIIWSRSWAPPYCHHCFTESVNLPITEDPVCTREVFLIFVGWFSSKLLKILTDSQNSFTVHSAVNLW